ncbi:MAG: aldehyde ferredoxin oxidoreductase family protein [Candidatus Hodarchaeota archaeon]
MTINGKLLKITLSTGDTSTISLDKNTFKNYIGGAGLAARILYPLLNDNINPLSAENPLIFVPGSLTGSKAPNCGRHVVCARSPLTGIWGESNSGGHWGAELKSAGWDGVLILERSDKPIHIVIKDDDVQIKPAGELMGLSTLETEKRLKSDLGDKKFKVSSIGLAGENLVKYAAIINDDGRAAGRTGMGAVMGSKNLKAISVLGSKKLENKDDFRFEDARKQLIEEIQENFSNNMMSELGTAGICDMAGLTGDMSFKYFSQGIWGGEYDISGSTMQETILKKKKFCNKCPIGCGRVVEVPEGKYKTPGLVDGPEYETIGAFGAGMLINNLEGIANANYLCNFHGLDTITCGVTISFAHHLYEKGILKQDDTNGLELKWGDVDPVLDLIGKIARRDGFGDVLAEGSMGLAKKYNVSLDEVAAINGMEVPYHDPRAYVGSALEYMTSHRGACHISAHYYFTSMGAPFEEVGIECIDRFEHEGVGKCVALLQNLRAVYQSLSMCVFIVPSTLNHLTNMFSAATGIEMNIEELFKSGERINTLRRLINLNLGYSTRNEKLPALLLKPLDGGTEGNVPDVERMLKDYYSFRDWNRETGAPSQAKLDSLDLNNIESLIP